MRIVSIATAIVVISWAFASAQSPTQPVSRALSIDQGAPVKSPDAPIPESVPAEALKQPERMTLQALPMRQRSWPQHGHAFSAGVRSCSISIRGRCSGSVWRP